MDMEEDRGETKETQWMDGGRGGADGEGPKLIRLGEASEPN